MVNVNSNDIVITAAKRTAIGSFLGKLASVPATSLGAAAIKALLDETQIDKSAINEVIMGCVLTAGLGQAPARQAALKAGLNQSTPCTTLNKVCGSGMKAIMNAYDTLKAESACCVIAGGMESMSNAPFLLPGARQGLRFGHPQMIDHMFYDGLENADDHALMGMFAERCADRFDFSREQQDEYATETVHRARNAVEQGLFNQEITALEVSQGKQNETVDSDEQPYKCKPEKIAKLKPAFKPQDGTVTAANSSSISDGAAALMLTTAAHAQARGLKPLGRIVAHTSYATAPEDFTIAPIGAIKSLLERCQWHKDEVDLFEINEAFAVVTMAAIHELQLDPQRVNVHGGACALGHPIGASGARLLVTLLHALKQQQGQRGIASLCIGGGEATAVAIEVL